MKELIQQFIISHYNEEINEIKQGKRTEYQDDNVLIYRVHHRPLICIALHEPIMFQNININLKEE